MITLNTAHTPYNSNKTRKLNLKAQRMFHSQNEPPKITFIHGISLDKKKYKKMKKKN